MQAPTLITSQFSSPLATPLARATTEAEIWSALTNALAAQGFNGLSGFDRPTIADEMLNDGCARTARLQPDQAWEAAVLLTQDRILAIRATEVNFSCSYWGLVGHSVFTSRTLGDAWRRYARLAQIVAETADVEVAGADGHLLFVATPRGLMKAGRALCFPVMAMRICRSLYAADLVPSYVEMASFGEPLSHAEQERLSSYFGCQLNWDRKSFVVAIPAEAAERELATANEALAQEIDNMVERFFVVQQSCVRETVRRAIVDILPSTPTLARVAQELGMGLRSLQRRLKSEGVSFNLILDHVRRGLVIRYLADRTKSVKEVAYLAGFVDQSHFSRSCKQWLGKPPMEYRRTLGFPDKD